MKKIYTVLLALVMTVTAIQAGTVTVHAADKNIKKSMFTKLMDVKTEPAWERDTPEGMCVNGTTAYVAKFHDDGSTSIIKIININGTPVSIMPEKTISIGHGNDLTYYNGYIYAAGVNNKFYRITDNGLVNGCESYSVKSYTVKSDSGVVLKENPAKYETGSLNITHFEGRNFIFCGSINKDLKLTFYVGYFDDEINKFIIKKTIYGTARAFTTVQGITYRNGYLYQSTSDNAESGNMNKISEFKIGTTYKEVVNGKNYPLGYYGTFDFLDIDKNEIEALDFDSKGKLYVLVNIAGVKDPFYVSKESIG